MENSAYLQNFTFFEKVKRVHFIGVGGVSLSALCILSKHLGLDVSGSDVVDSRAIRRLIKLGVNVYIGHSASNIPSDSDMVVYSGAIKDDNVEYREAVKKNIRLVERSEYLAEIAKTYDNVIAIAGSHGKTTTTAMLAHIFKVAKRNPTMHLGGDAVKYGNIMLGAHEFFITEACEYRNSMAYLEPSVGVVTNIDDDHLDYYKTKKNITKAFVNFANNCKDYVFVGSGRNFRQIGRESKMYSVGLSNKQDAYAVNIKPRKQGYTFQVIFNKENLGKFTLNILGKHNIRNAVFAIVISYVYNIKLSKIKKALRTFQGVKRRYEKIGSYAGVPVISDYAHHPTEIRNSIIGLKQKYKNILVVFQPHTYSRTKMCLDQFKVAFRGVKGVIVYRTYPARELYDELGDEATLYRVLINRRKYLTTTIEEVWNTIDMVTSNRQPDLIVFMGAGDLPNIAEKTLTT